MEDVFEAARQSFFSGASGDAAASPRQIFTQLRTDDGPIVARPGAKTTRIASAAPELVAAH
jgi:hypothetical protein